MKGEISPPEIKVLYTGSVNVRKPDQQDVNTKKGENLLQLWRFGESFPLQTEVALFIRKLDNLYPQDVVLEIAWLAYCPDSRQIQNTDG